MRSHCYFLITVCCLLLVGGCTRDRRLQWYSMWNESRYKPMEPAALFNDNTTARPMVPGTVARGQLRENDALFTGRSGGRLVTRFPFPITQKLLQRGQERFDIFCSPCHGRDGRGQGMIVRRGFPPPPDYRIARLREAPVGHFYDVITNGYGVMFSYATRVQPNDRWAIAAYIRALQKSQPGTPPDVRKRSTTPQQDFGTQMRKGTETGTTVGQ